MAELVNGFGTERMAPKVGPSGIDICYQRAGDPEAPAVLLIMGLAAQMISWPDAFCQRLLDRGLQWIRFDNRDSGLSTHLTKARNPDLRGALMGDFSSAAYMFSDMAADAIGLLDHVGLGQVHVVGASMGGAIGQTMAIEQPERVRSLTSVMSTTGSMLVGQPSPGVVRELFSGAPATTREEVMQQMVRASRLVGSPWHPADEKEVAEKAGHSYDRGHDPVGTARQAVASVASGDRTERLRRLSVPTLVIHGIEDRMCDVSGGDSGRGAGVDRWHGT